jgi:predicted DNA-binding protein (MmcQ/YjbR family)
VVEKSGGRVTYKGFNQFCAMLKSTTHVVQWGGADVWKVGGKVFAIGGWADEEPAFTFKTDDEAFDALRGLTGVRPAPYFASRGMSWIQHYARPGLSDKLLKHCLQESHHLASLNLSKKKRRELGIGDSD